MADERDSVEFEQTEQLVKFGAEKSRTYLWASIFIALSVFITGHALMSIYDLWTDDSIPLVVCPRSFDLDSPVVMNTVTDLNKDYIQDRWIRGFVRRYVLSSFPRTQDDAQPFYEFARDHSTGEVRSKFESYLEEIDEIRVKIRADNLIRFYAKNSQEMRIRPSEGRTDQWIVEVEGYLVKNLGGRQERSVRTLRYTVQSAPATRSNPDGLNVVATDLEYISDYVSGQVSSSGKEEEGK